MKPTLLVLAAGMGSRYGGLKQIDPIGPNGETLLDYSVYDAIREGFGKIVFVIRRDLETAFRKSIGARYENEITVEYVFQELDRLPKGHSIPEGRVKPWGTGHAILCAKDTIGEPFGVINADDFYGRDAYSKLATFLGNLGFSTPPEHAIIAYRLGNTLSENGTVSRGICQENPTGLLASVTEMEKIEPTVHGARCPQSDAVGGYHTFSGDEPVSMNLWGFGPEIFTALERQFSEFLSLRGGEEKSEFFIPTVVDTLIHDDDARVHLIRTDSQWFGVTYREDAPLVALRLRALIDAGEYPAKLG